MKVGFYATMSRKGRKSELKWHDSKEDKNANEVTKGICCFGSKNELSVELQISKY